MTHEDHWQCTKQHASRRDVHRRYPLWVYDDDDWSLMHGDKKLPVGDLICPARGCRAELIAVERKNGTRFLRNRKGTSDCGHAFGRAQSGGPPSAEHRWLQQRLAMLCDTLGYGAVQEHYESRADVWVESTPPLAIEIQRWPTAFAGRTEARRSLGAEVLWLLPETASSQKAGQEMFRRSAARIRVMKRDDRSQEARPWEPEHSGEVRLWVGATVMKPSPDGLTLVSAGNYDARDFLREVIKGERRWYGPNESGFKFGSGWARPDEVEQMQRARRNDLVTRARAITPAVQGASPPTENACLPADLGDPETENRTTDPISRGADPIQREDHEAPAAISPATLDELELEPEVDGPRGRFQVAPIRGGWFQRFKAWLKAGGQQ